MFESFFKKIKTNILGLGHKIFFLSEFKNFSFILNFIYICFLTFFIINFNWFYALNESFLGFLFNYLNYFTNFYFVVTLLFLLVAKNIIFSYIIFSSNLFNSQNNFLYLHLLFYSYTKDVLFITLNFYVSYLYFFIIKIFKLSLLFSFFTYKIGKILKPISWYPIFKRHSIFGYYRIARQNWVELKTEEVNFLKY